MGRPCWMTLYVYWKFLNCSYFTKIMTRKPKNGNLTKVTEPFLESKKWYLLFKGILWSRDLLVKTIKAHELESNVEKSFLFAPLTQSASFWCFSDMIYGNELVLDLWFESRFRFLYIVPNIKLFKAWTGGILTNSWNYCLKTFSFVIQNNGQSHLGASFVRWARKLTCLAFVWILTPGKTDPQPTNL